MTEPSNGLIPYRVVYSERVRDELKALAARAKERGLLPQFLAAMRALDARLRIYPQFGEPLMDLVLSPAQLWIGILPPLVVEYWLDEEKRLVVVGIPIRTLRRSGFETANPTRLPWPSRFAILFPFFLTASLQ